MYRELCHIWGPFSINSYGLFIAIGLGLMMTLVFYHPMRRNYLTDDQVFQGFFIGIIATLSGGRLLYILEKWRTFESFSDIFAIWQGGLSILGALIGCITALLGYFILHKIPILPVLDLGALYAPLAQAFGRIGCFMAGCCHGIVYTGWQAITYTDPNSFAPLHKPLHPTQLYSAATFLGIFILLQLISRLHTLKDGQLFTLYLFCASMERFAIDFWRADRGPIYGLFSLHQWIAATIAGACLLLFAFIAWHPSRAVQHESI